MGKEVKNKHSLKHLKGSGSHGKTVKQIKLTESKKKIKDENQNGIEDNTVHEGYL